METNRKFFAVGMFVIAGLVGLAISVAWLSLHKIDYTTTYEVHFSGAVTGVASGTAVRYNGIDVGYVSNIELDRTDPQRVIALLELRPGLPIRTNSAALV